MVFENFSSKELIKNFVPLNTGNKTKVGQGLKSNYTVSAYHLHTDNNIK